MAIGKLGVKGLKFKRERENEDSDPWVLLLTSCVTLGSYLTSWAFPFFFYKVEIITDYLQDCCNEE